MFSMGYKKTMSIFEKSDDDMTRQFVRERVAVWEARHELLSDKGRDCMFALLWGCLNISADQVRILAEHTADDDLKAINKNPLRCFCDRDPEP